MHLQQDKGHKHQKSHLSSVNNTVDDTVPSNGLTRLPGSQGSVRSVAAETEEPIQDVAVVSASSRLASQPSKIASGPSLVTTHSKGREAEFDEQQRRNTINATYREIWGLADMVDNMYDDADKAAKNGDLDNLGGKLVTLIKKAVNLPVPTNIHDAVWTEFEERQATKVTDPLDKLTEKGKSYGHGEHPFFSALVEARMPLSKRWKTQRQFTRLSKACKGLSSDMELGPTDGKLSRAETALRGLHADSIAKFLHSGKASAWLGTEAARLRSGMPRDYTMKVADDMLALQQELEGILLLSTQQTTQDSEGQTVQEEEEAQEPLGTPTDEKNTAEHDSPEAGDKVDRPPGPPRVHENAGTAAPSPRDEPEVPSRLESGRANKHTGQQREGKMVKDVNNSSLDSVKTASPGASDRGHGELGEGRSQRYGKRKHGPAGPSLSIRPADSLHKRPRLENSTGQTKAGDVGDGDGHNQLTSRLRKRTYPEHEDTEAGKGQGGHSSDEGSAEESQAEESQAEEGQATRARFERPLNRDVDVGDNAQVAETNDDDEVVRKILSMAVSDGFSRWVERTCGDTVKGEGGVPCSSASTYYERMAIDSFRMLCKSRITITTITRKEDKYLRREQVARIVEEVFVRIFPSIFDTLFDLLEKVQMPDTVGDRPTLASQPGEGDEMSKVVLKVWGMLGELDRLHSTTLQGEMREYRLLVDLRMVYDAMTDPSADINSLDPDLQEIIQHIRRHTDETRKPFRTTKSKAKEELARLLCPNPADGNTRRLAVLEKHMRSSIVVSAMVRTWSIGCIWARPKKHATAWANVTSGLDQIFSIIRQCDPDDRVLKICQSLDRLTLAYTDAQSTILVDPSRLDGLDQDPLSCIIRVVEEQAVVSSRVEEEYSPLPGEQGERYSLPALGGGCISGGVDGRPHSSPVGDTTSGDAHIASDASLPCEDIHGEDGLLTLSYARAPGARIFVEQGQSSNGEPCGSIAQD